MKKLVQRIAIISFLGSWILIGMAMHHPSSLECRQEWRAGFVNDSILVKEADSDASAENGHTSKENAELFLPGRAISILQ
jgi:hypothetical protein